MFLFSMCQITPVVSLIMLSLCYLPGAIAGFLQLYRGTKYRSGIKHKHFHSWYNVKKTKGHDFCSVKCLTHFPMFQAFPQLARSLDAVQETVGSSCTRLCIAPCYLHINHSCPLLWQTNSHLQCVEWGKVQQAGANWLECFCNPAQRKILNKAYMYM